MEIDDFISLLNNVADHFKQERNLDITPSNIEDALFLRLSDKYGFEWRGSLWDINISKEEAILSLTGFDFSLLNARLETDTDILPSALLLEHKVRIKSNGIIWIIHLYDKDPFPSNPHAHQLENNIKLDLSTGKCFKSRNYIHTISKKDLLEIRNKAEKVFKGKLPELLV
jgi:hypothetical protein